MVKIINVWHLKKSSSFNRSYFKRDYGIIPVYKSSAKVDRKMFLASYKYFDRVRESTARRFPRPSPSPPVATPSIDYRYQLWSRDKYRTKRMYREFTRVLYIYRQPGSVHTRSKIGLWMTEQGCQPTVRLLQIVVCFPSFTGD